MKKVKGSEKKECTRMKAKDGNLVNGDRNVRDRWKEYFGRAAKCRKE